MTNRDILNRELINHLFVRLFNQILDIEGRYMSGKGIEDLSLSELHIIDVISSLPNPAMSNIASKATLTNGTITTAIKKLEVKGYVKRRKDDLDRRIIRVELTTKGNRACKVHREFHEEYMNGLKVLSTGYYAPQKVLDNFDLEQMVETSDEWIVSRTGIKKRHIVENESCMDLGYQAALKAIEKIDKNKIGLIICATMTPDYFTPSMACLIQERLGLNEQEVMCFDLNAACSGFVYALTVAHSLLQSLDDKYALIIGSEEISKIIDFTDRNTCVLFGDGAGAIVVSKGTGIFASYCNSSGNLEALKAPAINKNENNHYLTMAGQDVFKFAVKVIPESIDAVLEKTSLTLDDIKYVVCHQANYRIIRNVYKKMKSTEEKFYMNLQEYGNTSAASIPLALGEMNEKGMLNPGDKIICVGFGGGLTWGATLIEWS